MQHLTARCFAGAVVLALALPAASWAGPDIIEGDDAGSLPANAKETIGTGSLNSINGKLGGLLFNGPGDFEDMYLINIPVPTLFSATTAGGGTTFDTQIFLFHADGSGLLANDDENAVSMTSMIGVAADDGSGATITTPGLYYLAISGAGNTPSSSTGEIFAFAGPIEVSGPDGPGGSMPVSAWTLGGGATGDYTISLTGCEFASPPDYQETTDAGATPMSADEPEQTGGGRGPLNSIGGDLAALGFGAADFADLYLINIVDPDNFKASTTGGLVNFNTQLWLFDHTGRGVLGNDDDPAFGVTSILESSSNDGSGAAVIEPGLYYLGISGFDHDPNSDGSAIFDQSSATEISGPDGAGGRGVVTDWSAGGGQGSYTIFLEGVEYPAVDRCPEGTIAECADLDSNLIRDDGCVWWDCVFEVCVPTAVVFADMGGQFGVCPPDGAADNNDRSHALNCFADVTPGGGAYLCEDAPPVAYNVDAGGPFGDCNPDGVCDGNDAFHALNAFGGSSRCTCPLDGAPTPQFELGKQAIERARVTLETTPTVITPCALVEIDVYLDTPLDDLRGYQLHLGVAGGLRGQLELIDISIDGAAVFDGHGPWTAFNVETGQMVAGLDQAGIHVEPGYLATFTYRATCDARGEFTVELHADRHDRRSRTFLMPTFPAHLLEIDSLPLTLATQLPPRVRGMTR